MTFIFFLFFRENVFRLGSSCESSARQTIYKKCNSLISLKNTKKQKQEKKMSSAAVLITTLKVNISLISWLIIQEF